MIVGSADMMSLTADESKQQRHMDSMRVASHGLSNLLDDVIDFASLEQDQLVVRREHLRLKPLVQQIVDLYSSQAEQGLSISFSGQDETEVVGDVGRLRQVLTNLVSNAVKFTEKGTVNVQMEREHDQIKITVQDSGPGIPDDKRADIFEPFSPGEPGAVPGRGLGLAVCYGLLGRMDSQLCLDSPKSGGSSFYFSLPVVSAPSADEPGQRTGRRSVLVVDDNEAVAQLLAEQVRQMDCDVRVCHGGHEALESTGIHHARCVILLDINMPDMGGESVAQKIEEYWGSDSAEIWFVTGNPLAKSQGIGSGMLVKPVDPQKLEPSFVLREG